MRIEIKLTKAELAALYAVAGAHLMGAGYNKSSARQYIDTLTLANVLRVALGLEVKQHGGSRPGAGAKPKVKGETA